MMSIANAWLIEIHTNQAYRLTADTYIGRSRENQIVLPNDLTVSAHHARIVYRQGVFIIYDLGAKVPIRLNGRLLEGPQNLMNNDELLLGQTRFRFVLG